MTPGGRSEDPKIRRNTFEKKSKELRISGSSDLHGEAAKPSARDSVTVKVAD
jgi:hypothetical protein